MCYVICSMLVPSVLTGSGSSGSSYPIWRMRRDSAATLVSVRGVGPAPVGGGGGGGVGDGGISVVVVVVVS